MHYACTAQLTRANTVVCIPGMLCSVCIPYLYHVPLFCTFVACQSGSTLDMFTYFACLLKSANIGQVSAKRSQGKHEDANNQKVRMYAFTKYTQTYKHEYKLRMLLCLNFLQHFPTSWLCNMGFGSLIQ